MIKNVNERKKAGEERNRLFDEWQDLVQDEDFDNKSDIEEVWDKIQKLDAEIEAFDKKFPGALKAALGKGTSEAEDSLKNAISEIEKSGLTPAQKAALRKSVAQAAKKVTRNRRGILDDVASLEDKEEELATLREQRDTLKAKLSGLPMYQQEKYFDALDDIESRVKEAETEVLALQRQALKQLQSSKAEVVKVVQDVATVSEVNAPAADEADAESEISANAKALYTTGFNAFKKHVAPHVPNDTSVEKNIDAIANALLTEAEAVRNIAATFSRDPRKRDAILAMASVFSLPADAFKSAMDANDNQTRVADWRDVLKNISDKVKTRKKSGDDDADADAAKFAAVMKNSEEGYAAIFSRIPKGAATKPLLKAVDAYEREAKYLKEDGLKNKEDADMYPGFGHVLAIVGDSMLRYVKLMRKALK